MTDSIALAVLHVLSAWLAADLVTGAVHWWEDRYGDPAWPFIGRHVVAPNILHHEDPRAFLAGGLIARNWTAAAPALALAAVFAVLGWWWLALVGVFAACANEVHAWSHQRCSRPIRGLQLLGVLASAEDHARHHRSPFGGDYCVMTGWLNPVLEAVGFWRLAEASIGWTVGVWPRGERAAA